MAIDVSHVCCSREETKWKVDLSAAVFIHKLTQIYITLKNKDRTINLARHRTGNELQETKGLNRQNKTTKEM